VRITRIAAYQVELAYTGWLGETWAVFEDAAP